MHLKLGAYLDSKEKLGTAYLCNMQQKHSSIRNNTF